MDKIKRQLFYVYKFNSSRLKDAHYNVNIDINKARENGELVFLGESQVIRSILDIRHKTVKKENIAKLEYLKNKYKGYGCTEYAIKKLKEICSQLDNLLFLNDLILLVVDHVQHYKHIIKNSFTVNGKRYKRLLCSAGQARKNTVLFVSEDIEKELKRRLNNGRDESIALNPAKFNAYFALSSSATVEVTEPNVCVVKDCILNMNKQVDFIEESTIGSDIVSVKNMDIDFNINDGMGIISPSLAYLWGKELHEEGIPSAFIIRNVFIKGMVCTFDFHLFAEQVAKNFYVKDIWGNDIDIRKVDMILTESQFKLWQCYNSWDQYKNNCKKNKLNWGVARCTPQLDNEYITTNYQFLQVLNLTDSDIENLCKETIKWISSIIDADELYTSLFLGGNYDNIDTIEDLLDSDNDIISKAILLNKELIKDNYISQKIYSLIQKKIIEAHIGKLLVKGNFQVMISDPYAFAEYVFGLEVKGLLKDKEHYSKFWNDRNVDRVAAMRSPLTWRSEVNVLNLKNNKDVNFWYKYIKSGVIYNVHGVDTMLHADSDFDFDIICTTSQKEFINKSYGGNPVTYNKKSTKKEIIDDSTLWKADISAFNSKIGVITNYSTSLYSMLSMFSADSLEYKEIINRLKITRKEQGNEIDKAKGIIVKSFPKEWITYQKAPEDSDDKKKEEVAFLNRILIDKKPYFMRYLYSKSNKEYSKYCKERELYCNINFDCCIDQLTKKEYKTLNEQQFLNLYNKFLPLNNSNCVMNRICWFIEDFNSGVKSKLKQYKGYPTHLLLIDKEVGYIAENYNKVLEVYNIFQNNKIFFSSSKNRNVKNKFNEEEVYSLNSFYDSIRYKLYEITNNSKELANIAVDICYNKYPNSNNKDFVWEVCKEGVLKNIYCNKQEKVYIPLRHQEGELLYLGVNYKRKEVK